MNDASGSSGGPMWEKHWPAFREMLEARLAAGHAEYGDRSFGREPAELLRELQEEALDLGGWGFILHVRCAELLSRIEAGGLGLEQNRVSGMWGDSGRRGG